MEQSTAVAQQQQSQLQMLDESVIGSLVINGDLSKLSPDQKVKYYRYRCQQAGLDAAAKPFDLLKLNGKEILYANASCTQQLMGIHKLSDAITSKGFENGLYVVSVRVTGPDGRSSENMAAVNIENLKGESLGNAIMKACTKAKRRTVLAHLGLGMLDETEVETIQDAKPQQWSGARQPEEVEAIEVPVYEQWEQMVNSQTEIASLGALWNQNKKLLLQKGNENLVALFSAKKIQLENESAQS